MLSVSLLVRMTLLLSVIWTPAVSAAPAAMATDPDVVADLLEASLQAVAVGVSDPAALPIIANPVLLYLFRRALRRTRPR